MKQFNFSNFHVLISKSTAFMFVLFVSFTFNLNAQYVNVPVTGYNNDIIANGVGLTNTATTGIIPGVSHTTVCIDGNSNLTTGLSAYSFVDNTYKWFSGSTNAFPTCGIPATIASAKTAGLTYSLQSASANNSLTIKSNTIVGDTVLLPTTGTVTLVTPASYGQLFVLYETVLNTAGPSITATVTFTDLSTQVITGNAVVNWFTNTGGNVAYSNMQRAQNAFNSAASACGSGPYLFEMPLNILPANYSKQVQSITFSWSAPTGSAINTVNYFHLMAVGGIAPCTGTPAPGNTISSSNPICSGVNFTLSLQNSTGAGATYQWQSSSDGTNYANVVGATSSTLSTSQTSATYYKCLVTCTAGPSTGTSNPVYVTMSAPNTCYCIPTTGGGTTYFISNMLTTGGITNLNNSSGGSAGYQNFFSTASMSALQGSTVNFTMTIAGGSTYGKAIWIDFNQDGVFAAGEQVASSTAYVSSPISGSFTVPLTATTGTTVMRVVATFTPNNPGNPCTNSGTGEYEDYAFNVILLAPCVVPSGQPISPSLTAVSTSQINGSFTAAVGPPSGYLVVRYPQGSPETIPVNGTTYVAGNALGLGTVVQVSAATSFINTGLSGGTAYDFYVYSYNTACAGSPFYLTTGGFIGTQSTNSCSLLSGVIPIGPTAPASPNGFPSITAALVYINANGLGSATQLELQTNYSTAVETFPITFPTNACIGITRPLTIRPASAVLTPFTFTSANTTATFIFDGATYITIDGRPGGTGNNKYIVIENTSTTAGSAGNAILLRNEASNNLLTYLDVKSANANIPTNTALSAVGAVPGAIAITGTTGLAGNDNNTISFSNVHSTGANLGTCIYTGSSSAAGTPANNDNNTIDSCNIYDFFLAGSASAGIDVSIGCNNFNITRNRIFQTVSRTYTSTQTVRALWITPNTGSLTSASGFVITGNYIGGNNPTGSGALTMTGSTAYLFNGMDLSLGIGAASSVQNNTITNITQTTANTGSTAFVGINIANGIVNIGTVTGNLIGSTTSTPGINFTATANTGGVLGIRVGAGSLVNISNNTVAGIQLSASVATVCPVFNGINVAGGTIVNITNNTVGSTSVANSINAITASTSTSVHSMRGIVVNGGTPTTTITGNLVANMNTNCISTGTQTTSMVGIQVTVGSSTVSGNTIRNLTSSVQTTSGGTTAALLGISYSSATAPATITGNTIHTLKLTHPTTTAATALQAIAYTGPTTGTNVIEKNNIHSLSLTSPTNTTGYISGMDVGSGLVTIKNNMMRLGLDENGNSVTQGIMIRGISSNSTTQNIYHNSIYIGGTGVVVSAVNTFCFQKTGGVVIDAKNNIFQNSRSNATTGGKHYAVNLNNTTTTTMSNNDYYGTGTGYVFAFNGTVDVPAYLGGWITGDNSSQVGNPQFINPTGNSTLVDLHIHPTNQTVIEQNGVNVASVTDDFDSQSRIANTPDDIGADAGNFAGFFCVNSPVSVNALFSNATPICGSGSKTLSLNGYTPEPGLAYQWQESVTGLPGSFVNVTTGTGGATSTYNTAVLTSSVYYKCRVTCVYATDTIYSNIIQAIVNSNPVLSITPLTGTNVCSGSNVDLTASGASTYSWACNPGVAGYPAVSLFSTPNNTAKVTSRPSSTLSSGTGAPPTTVATPTWTYTVTGTSAAGCTSTATTTLSVITTPSVPLQVTYTTSPSPVCTPGAPVILTVNNGGSIGGGQWSYNWYDQAGITLLQSTTTASASNSYTTPPTTVNGNNVYTVKVSNTLCPNSYAIASPTFFVGYTSLNVETDANCGDNGTLKVYPEGQTNFSTWYSNNFNTGLLGPAFDALYGNASISSGRCNITSQVNSQNGTLLIRNSAGINTNNLQVDFNLSTAPLGFAFNILGADGLAWSYASDVWQGQLTPGTGGFQAEGGSGTGFKLAFDATANGPGNTPGCYLMFNCTTPDQGPTSPGVIAFKQGSWWQGLVNAPVSIIISQNGFVTVTVNNQVIFDHVPLPTAYLTANKSNWIHAFTARTGGSNELHAIDDLNIRYNTYEYSINSTNGTDGSWQTSNTFAGLAADTFPVWVRNPSNTACVTHTGDVIIDVAPSPSSASTIVANGSSNVICPGSTITLTTSVEVPGATFLWEESSSVGGPWIPATGTNNQSTYSTPGLSASTYYRCTFTCPNGSPVTSAPLQAIVNLGTIVSTNSPQLISCQGGSATLTATPGANTTCVWYTAPSGGTPIGSGNSISVTPTVLPAIYYVEPATTLYTNKYHNGGQTVIANTFGDGASGLNITTKFTTNQSIIIDSIKVLPGATGTLNVALQAGNSAVNISSFNFTVTSTMVGNFVNVPVNLTVPGAGNYQLTTTGVACSYYSNYTGTYSAPYMNLGSGAMVVTGASTAPTTGGSTALYGSSFRISISTSCPLGLGSRIPVQVNVDPSTIITATPASSTHCFGEVQMLTASSSNAYDTYTWLPATGLYTDNAATIPYTGGSSATLLYAMPGNTTTYTVTGTVTAPGPLQGCSNIAKALVDVNPIPATPNILVANTVVCSDGNMELTAESTTLGSFTISGTSPGTTTSVPSPFYRLFEGARQQYIVRGTELTAAGMTAGGITSVSFNATAIVSPNNQDGFTVKAGFTTTADLSAGWISGLPVVSGPQNINSIVGGNTFLFNSPVIWDGSSNLVIEICWDNDPANTCSAGSPVCWGNTSTTSIATAPFAAASRYYYSDNTSGTRDMCSSTLLTGTTQSRPVMTLGFGNAVDFLWSPAYGLNTTTGANVIASPNVATTYTVTASNVAGCTTTNTVALTVAQTAVPRIVESYSADTVLFCSNVTGVTIHVSDTVNYPSGFPVNTMFEWVNYTPPLVGLDSFFVSGPGDYTVIVYLPGNFGGCVSHSDSINYNFDTPAPLQIMLQDTIKCFGETNGNAIAQIAYGGTPPFHYVWRDENYLVVRDTVHNDFADTLMNVGEGWFHVNIADKFGVNPPPPSCYIEDSVYMYEPSVLVSGGMQTSVDCNGNATGSVDLTTTGGTEPYIYAWSNGSSDEDIFNLTAGTYTVSVTDYHGCTTSAVTVVTEPPVLSTVCSFSNVTINGLNNGTASTLASGGTPGYYYEWSNGASTSSISGLAPGNYCVVVTDANGCTISCCVTITQPDPLVLPAAVTNVTCRNAKNGTISVTPTGGVPPFTYLWTGGNTNANRTNLSPGTYCVTVTDANGAVTTNCYTIYEPATYFITNISKTNVRCGGKATGKAIANPTGGWGGYTFLWSTGETTSSIANLTAGAYSLTVSDAGGCVKVIGFNITQNPLLTGFAMPTGPSQAMATPSGGVAPYTYYWNSVPPQATQTATGLSAGSIYKVKITDSKGCTVTATVQMPLPKTSAIIDESFKVFAHPNPTTGIVNISFNTLENFRYTLRLFDLTGREVYRKEISKDTGSNSNQFDFGALTQGVYQVVIESEKGKASLKIVLQ